MFIAVLFVRNRLFPLCADHVYCLSIHDESESEEPLLNINIVVLISTLKFYLSACIFHFCVKNKRQSAVTHTDGTITL